MTRRLVLVVAVGAAAIAAAATGAFLSLRGTTAPPPVAPTWGLFDDAAWRAVAAQLPTLAAETLHVVAATSQRLALVGDGRCVALVRGTHVSAPICSLDRPLLAFSRRDGDLVDVVGLAGRRVSTLVIVAGGLRQGGALIPAGPFSAFAFSSRSPLVLQALDGSDVVAQRYCASDLRGVCGMSAHRRS